VAGAVTTILLGIAGQQSLSDVFASLGLLLSRPFTVGNYIRLKSGALGGVTDGLVAEIGITCLRLDTEEGTAHLPNSQVLAPRWGRSPGPRPGNQSRSAESIPSRGPAKPAHDGPPYGGPPYGSP
jgi:Mechanosensitive ion channel